MLEDKKTARLEARLPVAVHALLKEAAALQGRTLSDFVIASAREAAEKAIATTSAIELAREEQLHFAEALINLPPVSPALKKAAELHDRFVEPS